MTTAPLKVIHPGAPLLMLWGVGYCWRISAQILGETTWAVSTRTGSLLIYDIATLRVVWEEENGQRSRMRLHSLFLGTHLDF
jgi:hypothetical protein